MSAYVGRIVHYFAGGNANGERPKAAIVTEIVDGGQVGLTLFPLHFLPYHHPGVVSYIDTAGATNSSEFCCPASTDAIAPLPAPVPAAAPDPVAINSAIAAADASPAVPDVPPPGSTPAASDPTLGGAAGSAAPTATPDGSGAPTPDAGSTAPAAGTDASPSTPTAPVDTGAPPA